MNSRAHAAAYSTLLKGLALNPALTAIAYAALFVLYLILEVLIAMLVYMYINLYHPRTFGWLIGFARNVLNSFTTYLEQLSPDFANRAYATVLGELGPKSVLLLLIGLAVSALARIVISSVRASLGRAPARVSVK